MLTTLLLVVAVVFTLLNALERAPLWPAVLAMIVLLMGGR